MEGGYRRQSVDCDANLTHPKTRVTALMNNTYLEALTQLLPEHSAFGVVCTAVVAHCRSGKEGQLFQKKS